MDMWAGKDPSFGPKGDETLSPAIRCDSSFAFFRALNRVGTQNLMSWIEWVKVRHEASADGSPKRTREGT